MEKIQEMLDNNEIEYEDELPKREAEAMTVFITNKKSSFAVTSDEEEENHATDEADCHAMHGANLGEPQEGLIGRTSSLQDTVQADLRISSQTKTMQGIRSETVLPTNEMKWNEKKKKMMKNFPFLFKK